MYIDAARTINLNDRIRYYSTGGNVGSLVGNETKFYIIINKGEGHSFMNFDKC